MNISTFKHQPSLSHKLIKTTDSQTKPPFFNQQNKQQTKQAKKETRIKQTKQKIDGGRT
jgi:hypothetical protein